MRRAVLLIVAVMALSACGGGTAGPETSPAAPTVDSPLCDDLREAVRPDGSPDDAERAAARVLEQTSGGSEGVLPADVEAGLRQRAQGGLPDRQRTAAAERFVQEQCG